MNDALLSRFFEKLAQSPDMQREFVEFAARHGIDFSAVELTEGELDGVAGGLSSTLVTQQSLQQQSDAVQTTTSLSQYFHDLAKSTIDNIRA